MNQREAFEKWLADTFDIKGQSLQFVMREIAWSAWQAAQQTQWQPIETAPRDGTSILAYTDEGQCEVSFNDNHWSQSPCYATYNGCGAAVLMCNPTHWIPLPPEPKP